ncbi:MAG: ribosome recycling factor [Acidimicrobiia bacterium]|nr:ribosome recycling factor [Acidimicrobiia bacterium]
MIKELLTDAKTKMEQAISHSQDEFATVRTGRANAAILSSITVDYYGTRTPLQQLASFSVPEPRLLVVQPFDKNIIGDIEKAIQSADLGLNPANDGVVLRLAFPPLTEDRRRDLIKVVRQRAEDGRVSIRNIRRHTKDAVEALEGDISEDDIRRAEKELQDLTDQSVAKLDELLAHKETELLEV